MNIDIEKWKQAKKERHLSYDDLVKMTGLSRSTITNIFCGYIELPRYETVQIIEEALGLCLKPLTPPTSTSQVSLTEKEKRLLKAFNALIPPMQDYILESTEKLVSKSQNNSVTIKHA